MKDDQNLYGAQLSAIVGSAELLRHTTRGLPVDTVPAISLKPSHNDGLHCDFCGDARPDPAWMYPAHDFTIEPIAFRQDGETVRYPAQTMSGGWLACEPCRTLIQKHDLEGLARRAANAFTTRRAEEGDLDDFDAYRATMLSGLRKLHDQFFKARTGPGRRMPQPPPIESKPEYVRAMERQLEWLAFHHSASGRALWLAMQPGRSEWGERADQKQPGIAIAHEAYRRVLERGDVFYVSKPVKQLVYYSARTLPDATFHETMLPARHGFVVFEDPVELPKLSADKVIESTSRLPADVEVFSSRAEDHEANPVMAGGKVWTRSSAIADHDKHGGLPIFFNALGWTPTDDGGYEFVLFTDSHVLDQRGYWPLSYFGFMEGESWKPHVDRFEKAAVEDGQQYVVNSTEPHEIAFTMALLLFMGQRVLITRRAHMPRATRRRIERLRRPDDLTSHVQVITLRRYYEHHEPTGEHKDVDWQWQWRVRGHWREQPYPSQGVIKPIWIAPYTKGPEGKPFKDDDERRVFAVVR